MIILVETHGVEKLLKGYFLYVIHFICILYSCIQQIV
jgi:hypothetical protein